MYIEPNGRVRVIRFCPLDIDYQNTIYFTSKAQQMTYFLDTLDGQMFNKVTYQRVNKGKIRVQTVADNLYNCNYLAFENSAFSNKWFYAFITNIEYINNITSEITYVIDEMQTWHFDYVLMDCFVEREHSVTDNIGDNLVPENLDTGEYISDDYLEPEFSPSSLDGYDICFWCTFYQDENEQWVKSGGSILNQGYGSYYSGLTPTRFPMTSQGLQDAKDWLESVPPLFLSGIVSVNVIPHYAYTALDRTVNFDKKTTLMRSDGTAVKNKKCLIYPYNALYVTNNQGKTAIFRYEFFSTNNCQFSIFCDESPSPVVLMFPKNYKGITENFDEKIDISGFPQIAYNVDSYKAWLAQNASSIGISAMAAGIGMENYMIADTAAKSASTAIVPQAMSGAGASYLGGGVMGAAALVSIVGLVTKVLSGAVHAFMPPQARGQQGSNVLLARGKLKFGIMHKHITPEFATIIDDYFSMYGYATNKVKRPNRNARPEWNYVKTIGCKIDGSIPNGGLPADAIKKIEEIYNNGITFWNNPAHIGDYSYDNSPTI